jgi:precorrin-6x reductase
VAVSVATDYGAQLLKGLSVQVLRGRLNREEMAALMAEFDAVIDATHPYAAEVSENIAAAAAQLGLPVHRLLRSDDGGRGDWLEVPDAVQAARRLAFLPGNILLTTGTKDLTAYTALVDYRERVWVRILPSQESLRQALELGYPPRHIIAMHGPFSEELNLALLRQLDIRVLVTKRSGSAGGFPEKVRAARQAGAALLVISRPTQEQGETLEEILRRFSAE